MTPTSVSSRFNASPVIPWPRSSISLSMTSLRPSTRATPSPISRITPTFCLSVTAFAPAIRASISCTRVLIASPRPARRPLDSEARPERCQSTPDGAVIDVAADLHAQPPDQRRVDDEGGRDRVTVLAGQPFLDRGSHRGIERHRALELQKPEKVGQDGWRAAVPRLDHLLDHLPGAPFIQRSVHQAESPQLLGITFRLSRGPHVNCLAASSARRR